MHCIYYLFCKCRKKEKKEKEINKLQKLLLEKNLKNVKSYGSTIKKRSNSFPMHSSCSFIFKNYEYEKDEIKLFTDRAIKHHNYTKNGEKK